MDTNTIIEGTLKFRDGKKWKSRWCVLRKLSPVADCVHVQLYRDSKERYNNGQTKASLSLQHFLAVQSGFTLDKESNTIAILCEDVTVVFAFDTREQLIQWQAKIAINLGEDEQFLVQISSAPGHSKLSPGPARLHVLESRFCLTDGVPPRLVGHWQIAQLRKYGVVDGRFCFEGGSQCGKGEGLHVLLTDRAEAVARSFQSASQSTAPALTWRAPQGHSHVRERSISSSRTEANLCGQWYPEGGCLSRDHRSRSQENLCWTPADWKCEAGLSTDVVDSYHREESGSRPRCRSCHVRLARSSTVTGPSWTMDPCSGGMVRSSTTSLEHCQISTSAPLSIRALSDVQRSCRPPPRPPKTRLPPEFPAYKRPRSSLSLHALGMCVCDKKYGPDLLSPTLEDMGEEYYDTPRSLRNTIFDNSMTPSLNCCHPHTNFTSRCGTDVNSRLTHSTSVSQSLMGYPESSCRHKIRQTLHSFNNCSSSRMLGFVRSHSIHTDDEPSSLSSDPCWQLESPSTCECYANVKEALKCQAKKCVKSVTFSELPQNVSKPQPNYVNIDFAESLQYYENCRDCYSKISDCFEPEFTNNTKSTITKSVASVSCKNCCKRSDSKPPKLERSLSLPVQDEPPGYIRMSSITNNVTEKCENSPDRCVNHTNVGLLSLRPKSNSFLCLNNIHRTRRLYRVTSISDPEINLIPLSRKRPKIVLSRIIELISNVRPVTAQEIQKCAKKPSLPSYKNRIDESQYHSDDTLSSDTMVNTGNDMSVKGSMSSVCSETANIIVANRFLSASELNISMCSFDEFKAMPRCEQVESNLKRYKDHLRSLELPPLPLDSEYVSCVHKTGFSTVRRSHTLTFKPGHNRDSSSSNDSGVSTASLRLRKADFTEFEMPVTTSLSAKLLREYALSLAGKSSSDLSLPRRSKSIDPLGDLVFQFQDSSGTAQSTSALLSVVDGKDGRVMRFIDAPSTSSGTSDLSDYMDNLSISSYSSNDHPRNGRCAMATLKPRSGKEYHKIDRLSLQPSDQVASCSQNQQLS